MSAAEKSLNITRRGLFAGALVTAVASAAPALASAGAPNWAAYEARLRARLADAGGGQFDAGFARELLTQANTFRRSQRLAAWTWDERLADCARAHAADMAARKYFGHETPEGFTYFDRAALLTRDLCGIVAENLAWRDFPVQGTNPRDFETMWEQSHAHRANLAEPASTRAGYGVVKLGSAYYAAGVYADASIQLAKPLPLRVGVGTDLAPALSGASPHVDRLALTRPGETPTRLPAPGQTRALTPGVWQLKPLRDVGGDNYAVLSGPIFFVG
jgi:uncharacterized protein YkwD